MIFLNKGYERFINEKTQVLYDELNVSYMTAHHALNHNNNDLEKARAEIEKKIAAGWRIQRNKAFKRKTK